MVTSQQAIILLKEFGACLDARHWFKNSELEPEQAWNECRQADWLIWLARKLRIDKNKIKIALCECAKAIFPLVPEGEDRPRKVIEISEKWITSSPLSVEELRMIGHVDIANAYYYAEDYGLAASCACEAIHDIAVYAGPFGNGTDIHLALESAHLSIKKSGSNIDLPGIIRKHITWEMIEKKINKL